MSFLRFLTSIIGGIFSFFGHLWGAIAKTVRPFLELMGFAHPQPQDMAADEAEDALAQSQPRSIVNAQTKVLLPDEKCAVMAKWALWKSGTTPGGEPSLEGFTLREKLKLRQADKETLAMLPLWTYAEMETWLRSPTKALTPLGPDQLSVRKAQLEKAASEYRAINTRLNDTAADDVLCSRVADDVDAILDMTDQILGFRPHGLEFA